MSAGPELAAPASGAMVPQPFRVRSRRRETSDTWTLTLEPLVGAPISPGPGQFTMVYAFGVGEIPISVSGAHDGLLVHTVRAVGAVSAAIASARQGAVLGVRGPFGTTWPVHDAVGHDVLVIAGGVGLAPLRTAVQALERTRQDYGEVTLLYGGRSPGDLLFRRELESLRSKSAGSAIADLAATATDVDGIKVVAARLQGLDAKSLRDGVDQLKQQLGDCVVLLAGAADGRVSLIAGVHGNALARIKAGDVVAHIAAQIGGKGGGRPDMAQGGGADAPELVALLAGLPKWISSR